MLAAGARIGSFEVRRVPPAAGSHDRARSAARDAERPLGSGLTVSNDGKTILFTKMIGEGRDLVLIENFR